MKPIGNNSNIADVFSAHRPQMQENAKKALVTDLEKQPSSILRDQLIQKARVGYYSDFGSPIAMPKVQLIADLEAAGFEVLVSKVKHGSYDD